MKNEVSPVVAQSVGNLATAFSFVAALAWNEAVKSLISTFVPQGQGTLSLFVYALSMTFVAVIIGSRLMKFKQRFESTEDRSK